ncbi:class I SAM-dependent methyltransferase, partial [Fibrobacterota bacterium]
ISHIFGKYKKAAFCDSSLKTGDKVLVFCCGTGLDFPPILNKIGKKGKITGVDFSSEMLIQAEKKVKNKRWENIELIHGDVTAFKGGNSPEYDAGVCTLGMSIIPDYKSAYYNLLSHVKKTGEIIIGDVQLASGFMAYFNPLTILMGRKYGGTYQGHKNSGELCSLMGKELKDVRRREFFLGSYFYCIGTR